MSPFFTVFVGFCGGFYTSRLRYAPKVQALFPIVRYTILYTFCRGKPVFPLLKTLWKVWKTRIPIHFSTIWQWSFAPAVEKFFPITARISPFVKWAKRSNFSAKSRKFPADFTNSASSFSSAAKWAKSTYAASKKAVAFLSKSRYNETDGTPGVGVPFPQLLLEVSVCW